MIQSQISTLVNGDDLTYEAMQSVMHAMMSGQTNDIENAAFLTALTIKGETVTEIQAGAEVMREFSTKVHVRSDLQDYLVDPVGTGGTHSNVFNVSTASSIVASCAGVTIAKHGNRAASSKSGSADLLEAAGVNVMLNPDQMTQCIEKFGIGFMFAPQLHGAMKHVINTRKTLGIRTVFNLLGPLTNPSGAKRQVLGVFDAAWLQPMADVSKRLGQTRVMVVHSDDGLDEISIAAPTQVVELSNHSMNAYQIDPKALGISHRDIDAVRVNSPQQSLDLIMAAFSGQPGAAYDMILLNSAAIIQVAGLSDDYPSAIETARSILDAGQALTKLNEYARFTQAV
ncbi:anthranilate phosphoribosyltransferase [Ostreibacterium oceani]|uniref:Anthranilate phosphoribosyltransferase n=1 Tax=Ostreibacterium oceani TaxID=2654998 RepID=A0A6N7ETB1_9GAMM|nr:anthranilate phosphoribosyltransferase [Ostreibacterium oceani]MPV85153.1 anthranilate phosphoribosyltransferase [Ostreibacterium oceani]